MMILSALVLAVLSYLAIGALFAVPFALVGAGKIDPDARGGSWGFRLLLLPGATLFWPLLLRRWIQRNVAGGLPPREETPHKALARAAAGRPS